MTTADEGGIVFPRTEGADGRRSTTATGQAVLSAAAGALDPDLATRIRGAADWRRSYIPLLVELETAAARADDGPVRAARAGLAEAYARFRLLRLGGELPLTDVGTVAPRERFATETVTGEGRHPGELAVPYAGQLLRGDGLHRQLDAWVHAGVVEPSCAEAVRDVARAPGQLDLSDVTVALLGAGAEMGPLAALGAWGARVLAVDLPHGPLQQRIAAAGRRGSGRLELPRRADAERTGADVIAEVPELAAWLAETAAAPSLVVGSYGYAPGAGFVRLAVAADTLTTALPTLGQPVTPAYLATPTDVFAVPAEVVAAARACYADTTPLWRRVSRASGHRLLAPNYPNMVRAADGAEVGIADALVVQQGPNYALAKRLQRWRALVAAADGGVVSANVAPPTRTRSVLRNRLLAAAYRGAGRFNVEVFEPVTSSTLMAALLVHDVRSASTPAPADLLPTGAAHGGLWRTGYQPRSALGLAVLAGLRVR